MDIQGDHLLSPAFCGSMILFRKPVPTPNHVRGRLFGIMLYREAACGIVYRQRDGIVKRAQALGRAGGQCSTHGPEPPRQELAAMAQALAVDAVADTGREMPIGR